MNVRALITGASGFTGRHLTSYLGKQGVEVVTLSGSPNATSHLHADPTDVSALSAAVAEARPDYVLHLAGVAGASDTSLFYRVNTLYAVSLLEALTATGYRDTPVLLVGTSAEYGMVTPDVLPITEDVPPRPYSHYGNSKLAQTLAGLIAGRQGRKIVIARPFNIIGPGMPPHLALASFVRQIAEILRGQRPAVIEVGNLSSTRDFIDVADVVRIYWQLVRSPNAYGSVYNICTGVGVSMNDLLHRLISLSGAKLTVRVDPERVKPLDVPQHYGSPDRLASLLGYTPALDLDKSLGHILADALAHLSA